jgi:hypothetical protein
MNVPKPESAGTRADSPPTGQGEETPLRDTGIRIAGIPLFGLGIPRITGLFGPIGLGEIEYWAGTAWFVLLSYLIWQGNRYFLIRQRRNYDWFQHPFRKVALLLAANVFYTAPVTVVLLLAWYRYAGFGPDWNVIETVALMNVICVIFITHVYETVYLIQQRESDQLALARLERARTTAELDALKSQLDPHFLFNSLNTLSWLIRNDASQAERYSENLADVCRYMLLNKGRDLVMLEEELEFLERYSQLLKLRFGDAVRVEVTGDVSLAGDLLAPPVSLQVLVENAVKHNEFSAEVPLLVRVDVQDGFVTVRNDRRERRQKRASAGIGLRNLSERCSMVLGVGLKVEAGAGVYEVRLPARRLTHPEVA